MSIKINVSGDFFITDDFRDKQLIDDSVIDLFHNSDFNIINLEGPITSDTPVNRIIKTGPYLRTSLRTIIPVIRQLKVNVAALANNHILDYGSNGLVDTLDILSKHGISSLGAGMSLGRAAEPLFVEKDSLKIGILNFAENEWSTAETDKPGANPMDIIENVKQIRETKLRCDKVICILHGGHEYFNFPSPRMVKQYRFYAENGADAVIGSHTHCIGGYEMYAHVPIFYSLGNFVFTLPSENELWYKGLLLQMNIEREKPISFELFPVQQEKLTFRTRILMNKEKELILQNLESINDIIADEAKLEQTWNTFVSQKSQQYLMDISPINTIRNKYFRAGLNYLGKWKMVLRKQYVSTLLNMIRCESHLNTLQSILSKQLAGKK